MSEVQVAPENRPVGQLNTNRSLIKYILLSIVTFGIYSIVFFYSVGENMNVLASRHDGRKTMNYILVLLLAIVTFGIVPIVWMHSLYSRIGSEVNRRGLNYEIGASTFWLWGVLGSFIIVGPFISMHKLCTAMNLLTADYNAKG